MPQNGLQSPSLSTQKKQSHSLLLSASGRTQPASQHASRRASDADSSANNVRPRRAISAPPSLPSMTRRPPLANSYSNSFIDDVSDSPFPEDDDWIAPEPMTKVQRAVSVGNKHYGYQSLGKGFNWLEKEAEEGSRIRKLERERDRVKKRPIKISPYMAGTSLEDVDIVPDILPNGARVPAIVTSSIPSPPMLPDGHAWQPNGVLTSSPTAETPTSLSARAITPPGSRPSSQGRTPTSPRPPSRRRSSHKRVSLVAGRLSFVEDEPAHLPEELLPPMLMRADSQSSYLSAAVSTRPPSPIAEQYDQWLGERRISDYILESEVGRGAYGVVKRARQKLPDGELGPPLIIKQVFKSRILADCWKRHPTHGTIPIEIHVLSSISATSYSLPPRRPWDPARPCNPCPPATASEWTEGKVVKGHPNISPLLEFFEDAHYYYLVFPSMTPPPLEDGTAQPGDLFDLVELYPEGLPQHMARSFLGQIADALCFLHSRNIVHRDIKDENVVLGPTDGKCMLIDFGSSGIVRQSGWDTFSGTLDYAGPEILRGERYFGKEQDVWAFGVVAFVLLVGECPFTTPEEAQEGLISPFAKASQALDERCAEGHEDEGEEADGGGRLGDARTLVLACLQVDVEKRPTFEKILGCRFLGGRAGW